MIYLDNAATTKVDEEVLQEMLPYFQQKYGNASSTNHAFGWVADEAVKLATERIAATLQVKPAEIIFTSGATESINLALKGIFYRYLSKGKHIITAQTEHPAVLDTCLQLEKQGAEINRLAVDINGLIDLNELEKSIRSDTVIVAIMAVNNETGIVQPIEEIGKICRRKQVLFFCDATQAIGKIPLFPAEFGISMAAFSAHKIHGPKGVGVLWINQQRPAIKLLPQIDGGNQQNGMRAGTLNVPGIVALGKACKLIKQGSGQINSLREILEEKLKADLPGIIILGETVRRAPHISNIIFPGVLAARLIASLQKVIAVSTGSACTSGEEEPSHVLTAMGLSDEQSRMAIRLSLSKFTSEEEIITAVSQITENYRILCG